MNVIKRNGTSQPIFFDKITARITSLCSGLDQRIDPVKISQKIISGIYSGVHTTELDDLAARTAAQMVTEHPDYAILAARIAVSNLHKETKKCFSDVMSDLYNNTQNGIHKPIISKTTHEIVMNNREILNSSIIYNRDYNYQYFGFMTLAKSYLFKIADKIVERPQHMLMRVAIGIHGEDIESTIETYNMLSEKWFTHASPTLFNSGTIQNQMSSCFLVTMKSDSIAGIYETLGICAMISRSAGGIGLDINSIRSNGSYISGSNGQSSGIVPMLRNFDATACFVNQGNKRPGAFATFIDPSHGDIEGFLDLKKNTGKEELRARNLFYALWIPDIFMKRVEAKEKWSLFSSVDAPLLSEKYGEEYTKYYEECEAKGLARKVVDARELFEKICVSQIETGTPYMLFKDACNEKSNQKNLGTIRSSNLCSEIIQYSSPDEVAVCNLTSVNLSMFVENQTFNFQKLHDVTRVMTRNLNKIIDVNYYPVKEAKYSNLKHRPIGMGVQGLADAFILMRFPFESDEAKKLNIQIFETMYHAGLTESCELAKKNGYYESYPGSPISEGILQYDMWGVTPSDLWDWSSLRKDIEEYGVRNSLLLAVMPTASTAQILGNNESIEPYTSNMYTRKVISGTFQVVNSHLMKDLMKLGLWTPELKNQLVLENGSVQNLNVPQDIKNLYKTVWEISQKTLADMSADRGAFICQSQSFNIHIAEPNYAKLATMHFHTWKKGLKTGMYYLRSKPASEAAKFTAEQKMMCSIANKDDCVMCGS